MKYNLINKSGLKRKKPVVEEPFKLFGDWLLDDIQARSTAQLLVNQIKSVKEGRVKEIHSDGNAFIALIKSEGVILWNMYTDGNRSVPPFTPLKI